MDQQKKKDQKIFAANQVKDQALARARQSYENKKKDPNFVDSLTFDTELFAMIPEMPQHRRKGK